ncbi:MAG TPA: UDP-2,3-diacylglucosamine diphosphatase LpxI [Candidatus Eisenbacteria bacterium]|nr:UDP-2,3-diacylglucosamine diphosphatase LpxI [Candidatus Eisenbacteria bacterium]
MRKAAGAAREKLGLIAGNGKFPILFAEEAGRQGFEVIAVAHRGETPEEIEKVAAAVTWVYVGQLGKLIRAFERAGVERAVMAGGIQKARLLGGFRPDLRGARFLARMKRRDDDALLRGLADELAAAGITILDSTLCVSRIVPGAGVLTRRAPENAQWEDIRLGFRVAKEIGRVGIGQTVVVRDGVVAAVEAVEGTDEAIRRGGLLARSGAVVVKVSKPDQDLRFDVPAVGLHTIETMRAVKGAVLAVEAGKTIFLDMEALLKEADRCGISVVAVTGDE